MIVVIMVVRVIAFGMFMRVGVLMTVMVMMVVIRGVVPVMMGMAMDLEGRITRLFGLRGIDRCRIDDVTLYPLATVAAARIAMARTAAVRAVFGLFLSFAVRAFIRLDQRLTVGYRNLVVVRMDFAESEKAVAVATVFDEGGLQRRFDARDLGEVDIAAELLALRSLEIKFFDAIAANHDNPGLFRVGRIDQHFVWHLEAHGGGRRAGRQARIARPGDATVHLIRG